MGVISQVLNVTGLVFLAHAVYSSYEHSIAHTSPSGTADPLYALPLDIILETLISTAILCAGIVLGSPTLRPIQWSKWASDVALDDRRAPDDRKFARQGDGGTVGNPFRFLEDGERKGFVDVIGRKREFGKWMRDGSKTDVQIKA